MSWRNKPGGKAVKPQRRKSLTRRRAPKAARRRKPSAVDPNEKIEILERRLNEALEQQTATSEVLKVISSSPGDLAPVFQAMLENATRICEANFGHLFLTEEGDFRVVALQSVQATYPDWLEKGSKLAPLDNPHGPLAQLARTKKFVHITDLAAEPAYIQRNARMVALVEASGARTFLGVPMFKDEGLIGAIVIYRQEVRPFTDKQIELVQNFAAQAVIAIENTRLLNELRQRTTDLGEALEQQTATSEVLKVISSSPGELEPVFQAMLANAVRICEAKFGVMFRYDGRAFRLVASRNVPPAYEVSIRQRGSFQPDVGAPLYRLIQTKELVQTADELAEPNPGPAGKIGGARSLIAVPMRKENDLIGAFVIYRTEIRPFSNKQIELVQNFAAQAVIAIENTRLLSELRESLEQQTATSQVLKIIASSTGELAPVFQSMLKNATRICEAKFGILFEYTNGKFCALATLDVPPAFADFHREPRVWGPDTGLGQLARMKKTVHIHNTLEGRAYAERDPGRIAAVEIGGVRSFVAVPMLMDGEFIGAIIIFRQEVRPFTDKQIELVTNFAAQAVIAIENVRLLSELRELLQQQTATADVLKVISRSTFDLQTVLATLVESAARLCGAEMANIWRPRDGAYRLTASYGVTARYKESLENKEFLNTIAIEPGRGTTVGRVLLERKSVHIHDIQADPDYKLSGLVALGGTRTMLGIPMLREGDPIGVLVLVQSAVRPFTDKQIELATTFADQAVIAIENVRLFESVEARTRELAKSLEDLRTAQDRLVQTEKLASLGQLTAGIAHEIKNPLNFVNNFSAISVELIDELRQALAGANLDNKLRAQISEIADTLQGNLDKVVQHGKRADSIVKNMLLHSRQGSGERRPVDINAVVEESLNLAYHGARAEKQGFNITLEKSFDPTAGEVDVFPQEITRVLLNLISNGFYAATKRKEEANGGDYEPTLAATTKNIGDSVEIRIRDNGTGIPPEVKAKMFNPFFTTKPVGEGTGLGLSISHDIIVKQHGGSIEVDTQPGEFTEFRIVLPRWAETIAKLGERP